MAFWKRERRSPIRARVDFGKVTVFDGDTIHERRTTLYADPVLVLRDMGYRIARRSWPRMDNHPYIVLVKRRPRSLLGRIVHGG